MTLSFFEMKKEHAEEVAKLVNSAYRGDVSRAGWTTEADFVGGQRTDAELLILDSEGPDALMLCARGPGPEILGCVHMKRVPEAGGSACYFGMLSVNPKLQAKGTGKEILAELERIAKERWQARRIFMVVINLRPELIAFYERRGYRKSGKTEPFPYNHPRFGKPLRDDLYLVEFEKFI